MKKSTYLGIVILFLSITVQAQKHSSKWEYMLYTSAQFQQLDFTDFNQQLEELNLFALPNNALEINVGVTTFFRRYMSNISLAFGSATNESEDISSQSSRFRYIGIHVNEAFNFLNPESSWFFGPDIGINISYQQIFITGRNNSKNFVKAANNAVYSFERFSETSEVGLRTHKIFKYKDVFKQDRTIFVGIHAGYRFDLKDDSFPWRLNSAIRQNDLGINTGGWFGTIILGYKLP